MRKRLVLAAFLLTTLIAIYGSRRLINVNRANMLLAQAAIRNDLASAHEASRLMNLLSDQDQFSSSHQKYQYGYANFLAQQYIDTVNIWSSIPSEAEIQTLGLVDNLLNNYYRDMFRAVSNPPDANRIFQAKRMLDVLIDVASHKSSVLFRLGLASQLSGDIDNARQYYQRALLSNSFLDSEQKDIAFASAYWLARSYGDKGDLQHACYYLDLAMKLSIGVNPATEAYQGWCVQK